MPMTPRRPNPKRYVAVSRGIAQHTPEQVDTNQLGPHWTTEPEVAWNFALSRDSEGFAPEDDMDEPYHGTVVRGYVHRRHVIKPGTPEFEDWAGGEGVFGPSGPEREQTIRPGSPVHLTGMSWGSDTGANRHLNFKQFFRGRA